MSGGRTDYAQLSAPAIQAAQAGRDVADRSAATFGTARTGGATALNAERAASTQSQIDQIINQNLMQGRAAGAEGLQQVSQQQGTLGSIQLQNSLALLGLSSQAVQAIMGDARLSQFFQNLLHQQNTDAIKKLGQQIANALGGGGGGGFQPTAGFQIWPSVWPQNVNDIAAQYPPTSVNSTVSFPGSQTVPPEQGQGPSLPPGTDPFGFGSPGQIPNTGNPADPFGFGGDTVGSGSYGSYPVDPNSAIAQYGDSMYYGANG